MYRVRLLAAAKHDISQAAGWYQLKQPGLGKRFTAAIRNKVSSIKVNPLTYSIRYGNVRTAKVPTFPFMIHFVVDEAEKEVLIAAAFHTSLNPVKWEERL